MASHGKRRHLKRLDSPAFWGLSKKKHRFARKGLPGAHAERESIPVEVLLRETLELAETRKQAKVLINAGEVLVDGKRVKEGHAIGLMDVVSIPKQKRFYRALVKKGRLKLAETSEKEASQKYCKVLDKKVINKNKVQLNLHDGRSQLIEKEEDRFKAGDTLKISIPKQSLKGFLKLEKGARCLIYKGKHSGILCELQEVLERAGSKAADAKLKAGDAEIITLKDYLFVVDKDFAAE